MDKYVNTRHSKHMHTHIDTNINTHAQQLHINSYPQTHVNKGLDFPQQNNTNNQQQSKHQRDNIHTHVRWSRLMRQTTHVLLCLLTQTTHTSSVCLSKQVRPEEGGGCVLEREEALLLCLPLYEGVRSCVCRQYVGKCGLHLGFHLCLFQFYFVCFAACLFSVCLFFSTLFFLYIGIYAHSSSHAHTPRTQAHKSSKYRFLSIYLILSTACVYLYA